MLKNGQTYFKILGHSWTYYKIFAPYKMFSHFSTLWNKGLSEDEIVSRASIFCSEAYLQSCQTSMMEIFAKRIKIYKRPAIFVKRSIAGVWQVRKCTTARWKETFQRWCFPGNFTEFFKTGSSVFDHFAGLGA